MNNEEKFLVVLAVVAVIALGWSILGFFSQGGVANTQQNYNAFVASENPNNICATPAGYTDAQWKQHMSHHPDRYAKCLGA